MLNEVVLISCLLPSVVFAFPAISTRDISREHSDCSYKCIIDGEFQPVCGSDGRQYYNVCDLNCARMKNGDLSAVVTAGPSDECEKFEDRVVDINGEDIVNKNRSEKETRYIVDFVKYLVEKARNGPSDDEQAISNQFEYAIENTNEPVLVQSSFKSNENIAGNVWRALYALRKANKQLILAKNARKSVINELDNIAMNLNMNIEKDSFDTVTLSTNELQTTAANGKANNNHVMRYGSNYKNIHEDESPAMISTTSTTYSESSESSTSKNNVESGEHFKNSREMNLQEKSLFLTDTFHRPILPWIESSSIETDQHNGNTVDNAYRYVTEDQTTESTISSEFFGTKNESNTLDDDTINSPSENDVSIHNTSNNNDSMRTLTEQFSSSSKENYEFHENKEDESKEENNKDSYENDLEKAEAYTTQSPLSDEIKEHKVEEENYEDTKVHSETSQHESNETQKENKDENNSYTDEHEVPWLSSTLHSDSDEKLQAVHESNELKNFQDTVETNVGDWNWNSGSDETQADDTHISEQTTVSSISDNEIFQVNSNISSEISNEGIAGESKIHEKNENDITLKEVNSTTIKLEQNKNATQNTNQESAESRVTVPTTLSTLSNLPVSSPGPISEMKSNDFKNEKRYSFVGSTPSGNFFTIPLSNIFIPHPVREAVGSFPMYPGSVDTVYDDDSNSVPNFFNYAS